MRILVTGGSGMVGRTLQSFATDHTWFFPTSKEMNLMDFDSIQSFVKKHNPNFVIHLAANVGGLFKNLAVRVDMFHDNIIMNENILKACYDNKITRGIFLCSTCIFPKNPPAYPMTEDMILLGEPHPSNASYAWSKRLLFFQCQNYNEERGCHYLCLIPTNIFGPHDNFSITDGHVIAAVIHRFYLAKQQKTRLEIKTGTNSLRQFVSASDVARTILSCLSRIDDISQSSPIIIAHKEHRLVDVVQKISKLFDHDNYFIIDQELGQERKPCSFQRFAETFPNFQFDDFDQTLTKTVEWFQDHYHTDVRR